MSSNHQLEAKDVAKVASLARIKVDEKELAAYAPQLSNIIGFVEQLSEVDTDNVEPLANVVDITLRLREDKITDGGIQTEVLANAPETLEGFFVVPKVVE
jgi:aspartyl-tRNA(Asn)/glutamyl-tRNA(Gln) amidotransferase subunit C